MQKNNVSFFLTKSIISIFFLRMGREKALREQEQLQEEAQHKLGKPNMLQRALRKITRAFGKIPTWFQN